MWFVNDLVFSPHSSTTSLIVVVVIIITVGLLHKKSKLGIMPRLERYTDGHGGRGCHNYHATRKYSISILQSYTQT